MTIPKKVRMGVFSVWTGESRSLSNVAKN